MPLGIRGARAGACVIIFDCNGVLVDSERIAAAVAAEVLQPHRHSADRRPGHPVFLRTAAGRHVRDRRDRHAAQPAAGFRRRGCGGDHRTPALRAARHAARRPRAHLAARAEMRGVVGAAGPHADQPADRRARPLLRGQSVLGERRCPRQARARPVPACRRADGRAARGLHRGRGFACRRDGRGGGRHDADRFRRRQPREANLAERLVAAGARSIVADLRHLKSTIVSLRGY